MARDSNRSKAKRCKQIWQEFVTGSTFHGLPWTILAPQASMRVLWILLFIAAMTLSCAQIAQLIMKYLSKPTETIKEVNIYMSNFKSYHMLLCYCKSDQVC